MKKIIVTVFFVALVTLGLIAVLQSSRVAHRQKELAEARQEQEQVQREAEELQAANQRLKQERETLRNRLQSASAPEISTPPNASSGSAREAAATAAARRGSVNAPTQDPDKHEPAANMGNFMAKMMEDPEMRKAIQAQQRQMMDTLYAPLVKKLGLTSEQGEQFKDFLAETQMKGVQAATSLMGGSSSNRTETMAALTADQKSAEDQIKAYLGDERYAFYKDYQLTLGERMQLQQYRQQTAGSENALNDQQTEMLLAVMKEEKQIVAAMPGQAVGNNTGQNAADMQAMLSGEQTEKLMQSQELVNQRVFERARSVLPEAQLNSFGKFQTNQLQMMRLGMTMAKKMFAPATGEAAPAPVKQ